MSRHDQPAGAADSAPASAADRTPERLTFRSLLVATLLTFVSCQWLKYTGLVTHSGNLAESVPPVPAVAGLMFLAVVTPTVRRFLPRLGLRQSEVIVVYAFLCIAVPMASVGVVRMLFPCLTAVYYFSTPENGFARFQPLLPKWFGPHDPEIIRQMYEGSKTGRVPWGAWLAPLAVWTVFYLAVFVALFCLFCLFRRQWTERERLSYPLVTMALEIGDLPVDGAWLPRFFRNPIMWVGFALSFFYNLLNILHAFNPSIPALGRTFELGALFTERPWNALQPLSVAYRPELYGLGYFMALEVTFSTWVCFFALKLVKVLGAAMGIEVPGFPFEQEQGAGAYIALALSLVYLGRHGLRDFLRSALRGEQGENEPLPPRVALLGLVVSYAVVVAFCAAAGMQVWVIAVYFAIILAFALVYARLRAESGTPMIWMFPFWQQERMMINALGSARFAPGGDFRSLTVFSSLTWLSRGYYPALIGTQAENMRLAEEIGLPQRTMTAVMFLALLVGLWSAFHMHLSTYYHYGANVLEAGTTEGGYRVQLAVQEFTALAGYARTPKPVDWPRTLAMLVGFIVAGGLVAARTLFLRFPLHPLGYAMATAYGAPLWAPFFAVWLTKSLILKIGGVQGYKRLAPAFLGIVIGHFFTAGVVWGLAALCGGEAEVFRIYGVHFG